MASATTDRRMGLTGDKGMKAPVDCATTANITLSAEQSIDGFTTNSSRVLVKNQTDTTTNGIYDSSSGTWTRSIDANGYQDFVKGQLVNVSGGAQSGNFFQVTSSNPITVGSSPITFSSTPIQTVSTASAISYAGELNYAIKTIGHEASVLPSIDAFLGVDPTGAADSAAAITTAIGVASALGVRGLRFPGTYKVLSSVTLASNMAYVITGTINLNVAEVGLQIPAAATKIVLDGQGVGTIAGTCARAISSVLASSVTDVRIVNFAGISGATLVGAGYTNGIFLDGATRVWIENNRLFGNGIGASTATGNGDITVYAATNAYVNVSRNTCTSTAVGFGIVVYNGTEIHVQGNTVNGPVCGSSQNNGYGILIYSSVAGTCRRVTVVGNLVENTGGSGIYCADVTNLTVADNVVYNAAQTQTDVGLPVGGISFNAVTNGVASGNIIDTSGKAGIVTSSGTRVSIIGGSVTNCLNGGVYIRGTGDGTSVVGTVMENNTINLYADATAKAHLLIDVISRSSKTTTNGIDLQNVTDSKVQGVSSGNARAGVNVQAGANNVVSVNCLDNGTDSANTYDGITNGATNTKFVGCRSGNSGATGQRYGITSTGNYCTFQDNDVTRNQTDGLNLSGTALQQSGNRQSTSATPGPTQGSAVLSGGTQTVTTNEVRTGDLIVLTCVATSGTQGIVRVSTITNATSFVLTSSQGADASTWQYQIIH